jgi:hypothetical protein
MAMMCGVWFQLEANAGVDVSEALVFAYLWEAQRLRAGYIHPGVYRSLTPDARVIAFAKC